MRNPVRLKNLRLRFLPVALGALLALALHEPEPVAAAIGFALIAAGVLLRAWGAGHLVKRDRLTVTGPYAHLRHPLYAGTLLISLGFAVALDGWLMWILVVGNAAWFFLRYFPRKERLESALLESRYGGAYTRYRSQVPALLPSLHAFRPSHEIAQRVPLSSGWSPGRYVGNNELGTLLAVAAFSAMLLLRSAAAA